jgi:hypothetical protein
MFSGYLLSVNTLIPTAAIPTVRILVSNVNALSGSNQFSIDWQITGGFGNKDVDLIQNGIDIITPVVPGESITVNLTFTLENNCVVQKQFTIANNAGTIEIPLLDECVNP